MCLLGMVVYSMGWLVWYLLLLQIIVGMNDKQLEKLAKAKDVMKCSIRDLGFCVATKRDGATTVAATSFLAWKNGIEVFATGGIGGVSRGAEVSMDVSADLIAVATIPVIIVCAGIKSILSIPQTLEYLETQGVPVVTLGSDEFPAFFTRHSGCKSLMRVDTPEECASIFYESTKLGLKGMIVAVPISEADEADAKDIQAAQDQAIKEANDKGIFGRDLTPFLLKRVNELTRGGSLKSNIALIKQNADIGAKIAVALANLRNAEKPIVPIKSV